MPLPLSTERRIRARGCEIKVGHPTEATALAHMDGLYNAGKAAPESLNVYLCRFCHRYHVGHP